MLVHAARVFFAGGHYRPRELPWASGLLLATLASAFGVTGYTLPWDQLGFWAFAIVTALPGALDSYAPGAGAALVLLLRGGPALGQLSLSRCFSAHTFFLPAALLSVLLAHFIAIRKQGISGPL